MCCSPQPHHTEKTCTRYDVIRESHTTHTTHPHWHWHRPQTHDWIKSLPFSLCLSPRYVPQVCCTRYTGQPYHTHPNSTLSVNITLSSLKLWTSRSVSLPFGHIQLLRLLQDPIAIECLQRKVLLPNIPDTHIHTHSFTSRYTTHNTQQTSSSITKKI